MCRCRLITDPLRTPALAPVACLPGTVVLHRQSQHRAVVVALEGEQVWLQYAVDTARGVGQAVPVPRLQVILPRARTP
jgi:hypothetical protein